MRTSQLGQSTVEFLFTLIFVLGIIFLFISLAINATSGYMAHYATFMSSRSYLVWDNASDSATGAYDDAEREAKNRFRKFNLKRFMIEETNLGVNSPTSASLTSRRQKLFVGTYFAFKQKLSFFSWVGGKTIVTLISESFLGKEPIRHECKKRICEIMKVKLGYPSDNCEAASGQDKHLTYFDDGC